jgi:glutamate formiminotransferase
MRETFLEKVLECVPNLSVSNLKILEIIFNEIRKLRTRFSETILSTTIMIGLFSRNFLDIRDRESVLKVALNAAFKGIELIYMRKHDGQHLRLGAVNVVPFIPIKKTTIEDCIELAKEFGEALAEKCVYLFIVMAKRRQNVNVGICIGFVKVETKNWLR